MASIVQQPPIYYVASPSHGQPQVLLQMPQSSQLPPQVENLYLRKHHRALGILQMSAGCLCLLMELIGVCVGPIHRLVFTGLYVGVVFFAAGLLGFLAYRKNNHCLIIACMVMSIIAALTVGSGILTSVLEMIAYAPRYVSGFRRRMQIVKESVIIGTCVFELFISIIQASFTCATCCRCCWPLPRKRAASSRAIPATFIVQQPAEIGAPHEVLGGAVGYTPTQGAAAMPKKIFMPTEENTGSDSTYEPPPYSQVN